MVTSFALLLGLPLDQSRGVLALALLWPPVDVSHLLWVYGPLGFPAQTALSPLPGLLPRPSLWRVDCAAGVHTPGPTGVCVCVLVPSVNVQAGLLTSISARPLAL